MSLRKPKEVPKISKAREKNIDKLKKAIPKKKKEEIEFNCKFLFYYDKHEKKQKCRILLETVKLFTSLNYRISVKSRKVKNEIDISIFGLSARNDYLTEVKPAYEAIDFEDLYGEHTVNIIKQDGSINSAKIEFNLYKKQINLIDEFIPPKKNNGKFCSFKVDESLFSFLPE
jgi:hypothetical protein